MALDGFYVLRHHWSLEQQEAMLAAIRQVVKAAPLFTPKMREGTDFSQQLTNCGEWGWVAGEQQFSSTNYRDREVIGDPQGYRYQKIHPVTGQPWPAMPKSLYDDARKIAADLRERDYEPQSCLINYYSFPNGKLGMHQDKTEENHKNAIITYSLGDSCIFRVGSTTSESGGFNVRLDSGDVCILHGPSRMAWHAVNKLIPAHPSILQRGGRISLTVRMVQ